MNRFPAPAEAPARPDAAAPADAALAAAVLTAAATVATARFAAPAARPPAPVAGTSAPAAQAAASGAPAASTTAAPTCNPKASSLAPLPGPPQVTPGSFMAKIKARGYLIAGVDANTYHFEYFNPRDGNFEGFDIDMIRAVAQAIFGNPNQVQYKALTNDERIPDVNNGSVDIVAHTMTITCERLKDVDFSTVYFDAHQQVLVLDGSTVTGAASLAGQKVCATKGATSIGNIEPYHPKASGPIHHRLPRQAAAGPDGHHQRQLDPRGARGPGPVHQDRGPLPGRRALRPGDRQDAPGLRALRQRGPRERAHQRCLAGQLPQVGRQPGPPAAPRRVRELTRAAAAGLLTALGRTDRGDAGQGHLGTIESCHGTPR